MNLDHIRIEPSCDAPPVNDDCYVSGRLRDELQSGRDALREARKQATRSPEAARDFARKIGLSVRKK
jgi:hypothetical protein